MKLFAYCVLGLSCLACGCASSRYRIMMSGLDSAPDGPVRQKFSLFPCEKNDDGTFDRLNAKTCKIIKQEAAKYPDVFSDDGEVVRIRLHYANVYKDAAGKEVSEKLLSGDGVIGAWNALSLVTICTLPMISENEIAYRISLEFESAKLQELGVGGRSYDFIGRMQSIHSLIPFLGWCFSYTKPSDTPFYRKGTECVLEYRDENRAVLWQAAVARAAVELRKASREIDQRLSDLERKKKAAEPPKRVEKASRTPSVPAAPKSSPKPAVISAEDIPL